MRQTRKQKALELLKILEVGPVLFTNNTCAPLSDDAKKQCQLWLRSWVIPAVKQLVPELRTPARRPVQTEMSFFVAPHTRGVD